MSPFAVFWDQSFLWGLFVYDTLLKLQLPFSILSARDIRRGALENYSVLIVPGGWAVHKRASLGEEGEKAIRSFVYHGGSYLGFCGGAGLALSGQRTLNMVPVKRSPLEKRLPSASGTVYVKILGDHPSHKGLPPTIKTTVWWPSQFDIEAAEEVTPLGIYEGTGEDFWVSDIPIEGIEPEEFGRLEVIYGINLDPSRYFLGNVAILESNYGSGKLILSYPHLETPEDEEGNELLRRFLLYLDDHARRSHPVPYHKDTNGEPELDHPSLSSYHTVKRTLDKVRDFIRLGESHFLWFWRRPWILGWKRGVRGLEYSMLVTCLAFLEVSLSILSLKKTGKSNSSWDVRLKNLEELIDEFLPLAKKLLIQERLASFSTPISKIDRLSSIEVDNLRAYLFGRQMNHGGLCRRIFDLLDTLLFDSILLLKNYGSPIRFRTATTILPSFSA
ncbi:MAG: BPL-N domain-containing protein [Syntrophobacterales bacterium]|nr:BPL-N domain-containing protein [Syntrophobacterales bacterium]